MQTEYERREAALKKLTVECVVFVCIAFPTIWVVTTLIFDDLWPAFKKWISQ